MWTVKTLGLSFVAFASLVFCASSLAEPGQPGPGQMGKMQAFREALMESCKTDISTYCAGKDHHELMECLHDNHAKLSAGCQSKLPNPEEMKKRTEAMKTACKKEIEENCKGKDKRELMMCMHKNHDKLSETCKASLPRPFEHKLDAPPPAKGN